jgi:hypothetical protein
MDHWRLIPDPAQLAGFAQVMFVMAVLALAGRALLGGRHGIAVQIIAGWGVYATLMTVWGILTAASLRIPGTAFIVAVLAAQAWKPARPSHDDLAEAGRMLLVAAPLLWVMADLAPSQSDNLAVMLPNTAYLFDWGHYPTQDGPPVYTDVPVAPYNFHLLSFLGSLPFHAYAPNSPALVTVFLHLAAALLLASALAGGKRPNLPLTALGLAVATLLNPGFVPRVSFAGYGEAPLAITLMFSVWLALRVMEDLAEGRRPDFLPLVLAQITLILIKQQGIGLFAAHLGAIILTASLDRRIGPRRALVVLGGAALPAIALYLSWRIYVGTAFPAGELRALPLSQWQWFLLPEILRDVGRVILRHLPYFGFLALVGGLLALRPGWLSVQSRRALWVTLLAALAYNLFLLLTFVGHFKGEHSFYRYNTHQSLMLVLALALAGRDLWRRLGVPRSWHRRAAMASLAVMLAAPLAAVPLLRFDRDMPQPLLYDFAAKVGGEIRPTDQLALLLPGDNNSVRDALSSLLRFAPERRPLLEIRSWYAPANRAALDAAAQAGLRMAALSCTDGNELGLPPKAAAFLVLGPDGWRAAKVWPYPPPPKRTWWNWTSFIASEPFCLK